MRSQLLDATENLVSTSTVHVQPSTCRPSRLYAKDTDSVVSSLLIWQLQDQMCQRCLGWALWRPPNIVLYPAAPAVQPAGGALEESTNGEAHKKATCTGVTTVTTSSYSFSFSWWSVFAQWKPCCSEQLCPVSRNKSSTIVASVCSDLLMLHLLTCDTLS